MTRTQQLKSIGTPDWRPPPLKVGDRVEINSTRLHGRRRFGRVVAIDGVNVTIRTCGVLRVYHRDGLGYCPTEAQILKECRAIRRANGDQPRTARFGRLQATEYGFDGPGIHTYGTGRYASGEMLA